MSTPTTTNVPKPNKTVLITGCSAGGAGAAIAHAFQKRNYLVFATTRNPSKIPASLTSLPNVVTILLDVTSDSSVQSAAEVVKKTLAESKEYKNLGLTGLDVLINNAGVGWWAPILDVPMSDARSMFETNFFGPIRMVHAFGSMLVESKGTIVNVSSLAGERYSAEPFRSIYAASKAAITQASECWRLELEPLNVRVITLVMGVVKTEFFSDHNSEMKLSEGSYYTPIKKHLDKTMEPVDEWYSADVDAYAESVAQAVERNSTKGKVFLGGLSLLLPLMGVVFPRWLLEYMMVERTPGAFKILRDSRRGL